MPSRVSTRRVAQDGAGAAAGRTSTCAALYARRDELVAGARARRPRRLTQYPDAGHSATARPRRCCARPTSCGSVTPANRQAGPRRQLRCARPSSTPLGEQFNEARARATTWRVDARAAQGRDGRSGRSSWTRALAGARATGNAMLEAAALMNLGVASEALAAGMPTAWRFNEQSSAAERNARRRAARRRGRRPTPAAILVAYGPRSGRRRPPRAERAGGLQEDWAIKSFEVFGLRMLGRLSAQRRAHRVTPSEVLRSGVGESRASAGCEDDALSIRRRHGPYAAGAKGDYAERRPAGRRGRATSRAAASSTHAKALARSGPALSRLGAGEGGGEPRSNGRPSGVDDEGRRGSRCRCCSLSAGAELVLEPSDPDARAGTLRSGRRPSPRSPTEPTRCDRGRGGSAPIATARHGGAGCGHHASAATGAGRRRAAAAGRAGLEALCRVLQARLAARGRRCGRRAGRPSRFDHGRRGPASQPEVAADVQLVRVDAFAGGR